MTTESFEDLVRERQQEWETAQRKAAAMLADLQAQIAKMPDVRQAPTGERPWGERGIACLGCGSEGFTVLRYVTVNGHRHRAELRCLGCQTTETWDFTERRWLIGR